MTKMQYNEFSSFTGPSDQLKALIKWKSGDPDVIRSYSSFDYRKDADMQRQFTIELRVDYADNEKNDAIRETLRQCARRALATARFISDNPKATQVVVWSDDFFSGHEEIAILDDVLGEITEDTVNDQEQPSDELLGALQDGV